MTSTPRFVTPVTAALAAGAAIATHLRMCCGNADENVESTSFGTASVDETGLLNGDNSRPASVRPTGREQAHSGTKPQARAPATHRPSRVGSRTQRLYPPQVAVRVKRPAQVEAQKAG